MQYIKKNNYKKNNFRKKIYIKSKINLIKKLKNGNKQHKNKILKN